jgi:hypothetical protein
MMNVCIRLIWLVLLPQACSLKDKSMPIPAGLMGVKHAFSAPFSRYASAVTGGQIPADAPLQIYSSGLHMHLLGPSTRLQVERSGGSPACLLDIPRWDFHWQGSYVLRQPMSIQAGERMQLECVFDNPGAKDVNWGVHRG